jgi:hypothetical protein
MNVVIVIQLRKTDKREHNDLQLICASLRHGNSALLFYIYKDLIDPRGNFDYTQ